MKQKVYISGFLEQASYGKSAAVELIDKLQSEGYQVTEIKNHKENVWCRDYMPIITVANNLVQFRYAPGYMTDSKKWSERIPDQSDIQNELDIKCKDATDIILDGGVIEILNDQGIISDRVFRENTNTDEITLLTTINQLLGLKDLTVIPQHPKDFTGHVNGLVRFIDRETVLINELNQRRSGRVGILF